MVSVFDVHRTKVKCHQFVLFSFFVASPCNVKELCLAGIFSGNTKMPNCAAAEMLGLHPNTAVQWFSYLRDAASNHHLRNLMQIGDSGHIVEIDESVITHQKYHREHCIPECLAFGGIDPESNFGFLVLVDDCSAATLLPLIQQFIAPGSIIHSDKWVAYRNIAQMNVVSPYQHLTVNHSVNFVDPLTGCTTNHRGHVEKLQIQI